MPSILDGWLKKDKPTKLNRARAIRVKCLDCMGNQGGEVARCPVYACPLWPYRSGRTDDPPPAWEPVE